MASKVEGQITRLQRAEVDFVVDGFSRLHFTAEDADLLVND
jgi:hypothetical protein